MNDKKNKPSSAGTEETALESNQQIVNENSITQNNQNDKIGRTRNWTAVLYQNNEKLKTNWQEILEQSGVPILVSPLHDKDTWNMLDEEEDPAHKAGTAKSPHWHILLLYSGPISAQRVKRLTDIIGCVPSIKPCANVNSMTRYFCHLDQPQKHTYSVKDLKALNGFDLAKYLVDSETTTAEYIDQIADWIRDNDCTEYWDLWDYAQNKKHDDWLPVIRDMKTGWLIKTLITSKRNIKKEHKAEKPIEKAAKPDIENLAKSAGEDIF